MSQDRRFPRPLAIGGVVLAVILVNVLLRVAPVPDLPGWVDGGADLIHTVVRVKNWLVAGLVALVIAGLAIDGYAKSPGGGRPDA